MRPIDADVLYKTIDQEADFYGGFGDNVITASELRRCIEMVPTIDAVPVVRVDEAVDEAIRILNAINSRGSMYYGDYCELFDAMCAIIPNCGAKMDGGEKNAKIDQR